MIVGRVIVNQSQHVVLCVDTYIDVFTDSAIVKRQNIALRKTFPTLKCVTFYLHLSMIAI